jgi:hypothetical protein
MKYLKVMPHSYATSILPKLSHERCKKILQRRDVVGSVGGALPTYLINPDQFPNTYYQLKNEGNILLPRAKTILLFSSQSFLRWTESLFIVLD